MPEVIIVDNDVYEVDGHSDEGYEGVNSIRVDTDHGEFILFMDEENAGQAARDRWADMAKEDREEFRAIIGEKRLLQWVLGESDSFGISSLEEFLDVTATVPEEEFASYDHAEREVSAVSRSLREEWGFTPTVAYRSN